MSTINGNLDGYIEVILKMDDVTGEIKEIKEFDSWWKINYHY